MKCRTTIGALMIIMAAHTAYSQTVTIDEYLDRVKSRHPFFVKEAMQPDIETLRRDRALGAKDWDVLSSAELRFQKPIILNTFSPNKITTLDLGATAERAYWGNGSRLLFSWRSNYIDQEQPGILIPSATGVISVPVGPQSFFENRIFAAYVYPLLENRGGILDRLEYELSDFNIDMSEVAALENQEAFLLDIGTQFIDWALIQEEARISRTRLQFEEEQLERTRKRRRANLVDEVDVLRGEDAVQIARQNLVASESRFKAKQAALAVLALDDAILTERPEVELKRLQSIPDAEEAVRQIPGQRVVRALRVRLGQLRHQKQGLESVARPQLFLSLRGGLQHGDVNFLDSWKLDNPDVAVALDFRYPLGNSTAAADVAKSTLEIRQLEKEIESASLDLEARIRSVLIQVRELEEVMALNREQIETARRKTDEELKLYNQGRGDLTFVIQSRDNEARGELVYAVNAAAYHALILSYRALVDDLLPGE